MVIDGGLGSTEHNLPDKIASQQIMRKAQFDFRRLVQLGDLFTWLPSVLVKGSAYNYSATWGWQAFLGKSR